MIDSSTTPTPSPSRTRPGRRLRIIAAVVVVLGIFGADGVYFLGTRSPPSSDDPALLGNEKAQTRQEEILYGKQSVLIDNWTQELKKPGTQAVIVVVTAALVAGGCLYFARLLDAAGEQLEEKK